MTTTADLLARLQSRGVHLWVEADTLHYRGPHDAVSAELVEAIRAHKAPLIAALRAPRAPGGGGRPPAFSLLFFASAETGDADRYRLFFDAATFADENDFEAVWIPERHFHSFGGLYPNPSVLAAALAVRTRRVRLRAGSVVLPLQNALRVAEEWAVVDNLSGGRVDLSFAQGWNPRDFVLAPSAFDQRLARMYQGIADVRALWRGDAVRLADGAGVVQEIRTHPKPVQPELDCWVTCTGSRERFVEAGALGANVLTALLFQTPEELGEKIAAYRAARAKAGFAPDGGKVTLMMHCHLGDSRAAVEASVKGPLTAYLEESIDLWRHSMEKLRVLDGATRTSALEYAFHRYFNDGGLFGTVDDARRQSARMRAQGVDEIACLIDFGLAPEAVMAGLEHLNTMKRLWPMEAAGANTP